MAVSVSITLPEDVAAALDRASKAKGLNRSQTVTEALRRMQAHDLIEAVGESSRRHRDFVDELARAHGLPGYPR